MYKNYVFDLYGTLVDINTNEWSTYLWKKMHVWYSMHGAIYDKPLTLKKRYYELCREHEKAMGRKDAEIKVEYVFEQLFKDKGVDCSLELAVETGKVLRMLSLKYIRLYDGVLELFERLRKADKKIYLLSNAQRIFTEPEMRHLGIYDLFDGIIYSSDAGVMKPSPDFFSALFERYGLKKEESVMIGNDHICDAGGAATFGIDSMYWWTSISPEHPGKGKLPKGCKEIKDISEVFKK